MVNNAKIYNFRRLSWAGGKADFILKKKVENRGLFFAGF